MNLRKKFIVRTSDAGCFFGEVLSTNNDEVDMKNVRRLWFWKGACSLSDMAMNGVTYPEECKFTVRVKEQKIKGWIEILACSESAIKSIEGVKEWTQH